MRTLLPLLLLLSGCYGQYNDPEFFPPDSIFFTNDILYDGGNPVLRQHYPLSLQYIAAERQRLAMAYARQPSDTLLAQAVALWLSMSDSLLFPAWLGTPWHYYGASETPGDSSIACGYFVGTILRDLDFKVDRIALGDMRSGDMIASLVQPQHIRTWHQATYANFAQELMAMGPGLYIVGLDNHTGFLIVTNKSIRMVHSGGEFNKVCDQPGEAAMLLLWSRIRVVGCLSCDRALARKWLSGS